MGMNSISAQDFKQYGMCLSENWPLPEKTPELIESSRIDHSDGYIYYLDLWKTRGGMKSIGITLRRINYSDKRYASGDPDMVAFGSDIAQHAPMTKLQMDLLAKVSCRLTYREIHDPATQFPGL